MWTWRFFLRLKQNRKLRVIKKFKKYLIISSDYIKIKFALAHPAASNGVCSRQRSRYNGVIQNQVFSFGYMLHLLPDFPDFQYIFLLHRKLFHLLQFQPEFDRIIHFGMCKWALCFCFLHTIQSSILCFWFLIFFSFPKYSMSMQCIFWNKILY
jgi:hypothetical protein